MKLFKINIVSGFLFLSVGQVMLFAQPAKARKAIFDGKSFNGWTIIDTPAHVTIEDHSFVIHMTKNTKRHAFIRSNKKYKDFILELDCKRDTLFDSGILLRATTAPDTARVGLFGYMVKIDPSLTRRWTGGIFFDYGNYIEWMYPLADDKRAQQAERVGEWNHYRIEAIGNIFKVWINDIPVTHLINKRYEEGWIALKIHYLAGTPWNEQMSAAFKNIRIVESRLKKYARDVNIPAKEVESGKLTFY
ncbi:MAG: 3-keto-disaccharide hydrolase [Chitinophagaceae bacterium]